MRHLDNLGYPTARSYLKNKKYFGHVRSDKIRTALENRNIILEDDCLIHYNKYKKRTKLGNVYASKNDVIIHQISNSNLDYSVGRAGTLPDSSVCWPAPAPAS